MKCTLTQAMNCFMKSFYLFVYVRIRLLNLNISKQYFNNLKCLQNANTLAFATYYTIIMSKIKVTIMPIWWWCWWCSHCRPSYGHFRCSVKVRQTFYLSNLCAVVGPACFSANINLKHMTNVPYKNKTP